ncbi:MAG: hypothetical protein A4E74_02463 [Syntrophus sp. PtaB.Bin075]|nr:MAG: hypothetical protein A4E74_02463 [Syntrophus sp. PtaB.Bin075]
MTLKVQCLEVKCNHHTGHFRRTSHGQFFQFHCQQSRNRFQRMNCLPNGKAQRLFIPILKDLICFQPPMSHYPVKQASQAACFFRQKWSEPRNHTTGLYRHPAESELLGETSEGSQLRLEIIRCDGHVNRIGRPPFSAPIPDALDPQHIGTRQR